MKNDFNHRLITPLFSFVLMILSYSGAFACEFTVVQTAVVPWTITMPACLEDHLLSRDLAHLSLDIHSGRIVEDPAEMNFYEGVFLDPQSSEALGREKRVEMIKKIFATYTNSLRNQNGICSLKLYKGLDELKIDDFIYEDHVLDGQKGSRLLLRSKDGEDYSWELHCPGKDGLRKLSKTGTYFFIFVDYYEMAENPSLTKDFSQYLLSFLR